MDSGDEVQGAYQVNNGRRALRSSCALLGAVSAMRVIRTTFENSLETVENKARLLCRLSLLNEIARLAQ